MIKVRTSPVMLAFHEPWFKIWLFHFWCSSKMSVKFTKYLPPTLYTCLGFLDSGLAWPRSSYCGHLGEWVSRWNGILSLLSSAFEINLTKNKALNICLKHNRLSVMVITNANVTHNLIHRGLMWEKEKENIIGSSLVLRTFHLPQRQRKYWCH